MQSIITDQAIQRRQHWIKEIKNFSGHFANDFAHLEQEIDKEIKSNGIIAVLDHLRLCGSIPESYKHDSSEEKLYSKYTDYLLSVAFERLGYKSLVLSERGDAADIEVFGYGCDFVADAKVFRLSRTAKNQKDFKVAALHNWKRGKPNAMVVCPIYQLPKTSSQIYHSATTHDVCIFTYSHLCLLLCYSEKEGKEKAMELLKRIFAIVPALNLSKSAIDYWITINRTMIDFSPIIKDLWLTEKAAVVQSINVAKEEGVNFLALERERIMNMSHEQALKELVMAHKIESKIKAINSVKDNGLFINEVK